MILPTSAEWTQHNGGSPNENEMLRVTRYGYTGVHVCTVLSEGLNMHGKLIATLPEKLHPIDGEILHDLWNFIH